MNNRAAEYGGVAEDASAAELQPGRAAPSAELARFAPPALGVLGAALILLWEANHGVGLTWDSSSYISVARSLVAGEGFLEWNGTQYSGGAPLFPLLLAAVGLFGIDVIDAAGYVNAAAFGLTVFVTAAWLQRHLRAPLLAVWAGLACALSPALAGAASHAWTEIVFILCIVVSLSLLDRFLSGGKASVLLLAATAAGAACLTRYVGVTMIGAGALVLLLRTGVGLRIRVWDAALWSTVSLAPTGVWFVRNLLVVGSVFGGTRPDGFSSLLSLHRATGEFASWLFGPTGFDLLAAAFGSTTGIDLGGAAAVNAVVAKAAVLVAVTLGAGYALARYRPGLLRRRRTVLTVALAFIAVYALFLAIFLPLDDTTLPVRYLLPLFPPLLVAATLVLDEFMTKKKGAAGPVVLAVVVSLWLAQQAGAAYGTTRARLRDASGYAARVWAESDVVRYLNANRLDDASRIWSSEPAALYFHTELRRVGTVSRSLDGVIGQLADLDPAESVYLVLFDLWFHGRYDPRILGLDALPGVELVADLKDGMIFRSGVATAPPGSTAPGSTPALPAVAMRDQVVHAHFDVYFYGDALAYFKEPCTAMDLRAKFFLHLVPVDVEDLPAHRRQFGFENPDFFFAERGVILDGRCLAVVKLPGYPIGRIETGQFTSASGQLWNATIAEHRLRRIRYRSTYREVLAGDYDPAPVRSTFDVYTVGRTLTYVRNPCALKEVSDPFFLHVVPADPANLPARRRRLQSDFDILDFSFAERGAFLDGACVAIAALPDYEIARVRTGQFTPGEGNKWESTFSP